MLFKVCPHCGAKYQIYIENDVTGKSEVCLVCSYRREIDRKPLVLTGAKRETKYG